MIHYGLKNFPAWNSGFCLHASQASQSSCSLFHQWSLGQENSFRKLSKRIFPEWIRRTQALWSKSRKAEGSDRSQPDPGGHWQKELNPCKKIKNCLRSILWDLCQLAQSDIISHYLALLLSQMRKILIAGNDLWPVTPGPWLIRAQGDKFFVVIHSNRTMALERAPETPHGTV